MRGELGFYAGRGGRVVAPPGGRGSSILCRINVLELTVRVMLGLRDGGAGAEGEGGGGEVDLNLKAIQMNWSYCMDGLNGTKAISLVG